MIEPHDSLDTLLSRNQMIKWLYEFLNSEIIKSRSIKINKKATNQGLTYYCFRCEILQEFITEMSRVVKEGVLSNVHDSFIVFLNHYITQTDYKNISKKDLDGIFKDLITMMHRYEQKAAINVPRNQFGRFIKRYFNQVLTSLETKDVWWFVSLYKLNAQKLPKNIKDPVCTYYLICVSLDTTAAELKTLTDKKAKKAKAKEIESSVSKAIEELLKTVEKEDGFVEGILVPVKNTIIVDKLRDIALNAELRQKEAELQKIEAEARQKEAELQKKEAERQNELLIELLQEKGFSTDEINAELVRLSKRKKQ